MLVSRPEGGPFTRAAMRWPRWLKLIDDARSLIRPLQNYNPVRRAKRNVAHHYDLDGSLYDLFLDADRQYSCAYFETDRTPLDEAQAAKKRQRSASFYGAACAKC